MPKRCEIYGNDWTEWDLFKTRGSFFDGQKMTPRPLWGFYDDTKDSLAERQIKTACDYGIDLFIYLYYWSPLGVELQKPIDTFVRASTDSQLKFALMWSPHRPRFEVIRPIDKEFDYEKSRYFDLDEASFGEFIRYTSEHFFSKKNYFCINNKPVLYMYKYFEFVERIGRDNFLRCVKFANSYVKSNGFDGIYLVGSSERDPCTFKNISRLGFSATTSYVLLPDFHSGSPIQDYQEQMQKKQPRRDAYKHYGQLPYFPSVPVGFDASSRGAPGKPAPTVLAQEDVYPWFPIVKDRSLDVFSEYLKAACDFVLQTHQNPPLVNIASWNEWTQQHFIEPDVENSYSYLEAIRRIKRSV